MVYRFTFFLALIEEYRDDLQGCFHILCVSASCLCISVTFSEPYIMVDRDHLKCSASKHFITLSCCMESVHSIACLFEGCCGLTPAGSSAPHSHSFTPPQVRWERESEGQKQENSWVKIKAVEQVKQKLCTQAKQNKEFFHHFWSASWCSAILRKAGLHHV